MESLKAISWTVLLRLKLHFGYKSYLKLHLTSLYIYLSFVISVTS